MTKFVRQLLRYMPPRKTYMTAAAKRMPIVKAKKHAKIKQLEKRDVIAKARVAP